MSNLDAVCTLLGADGTLLSLLTGGIYNANKIGRMGINRDNTPSAFSSTLPHNLKPLLLATARDIVPYGGLRDTGYASIRQVIELRFYDDGDASVSAAPYATITQAAQRAFALLDQKQVQPSAEASTAAFRIRWFNRIPHRRDTQLVAVQLIDEYETIGGIAI